jgi:hypothetical protein
VTGLCAFVHTQSAVVVTSDVLNGVWTVNCVANTVMIYIRQM